MAYNKSFHNVGWREIYIDQITACIKKYRKGCPIIRENKKFYKIPTEACNKRTTKLKPQHKSVKDEF